MLLLLGSFAVTSLNTNLQNKQQIPPQTSSLIELYSTNAFSLAEQLQNQGYDILPDTVQQTSLQLIVTSHELDALQNLGHSITILQQGRPFYDIQKEQSHDLSLVIPPDYLDLAAIEAQLSATAAAYPSICKLYDLTTYYCMNTTQEGNHIYALKISDNVQQDEDEPSLLIVSCHHAREIVTPVIALYAIDKFTTQYGSDPDITAAVNNYEIWISPVWNPDGYDYMFYFDNWWRKNVRDNNENGYIDSYDGVDQNRNYPFGWNSPGGGSTVPSSETYRGPYPASEPETQTMIAFGNDQHFTKLLDYHSYGREVLYGYCALSHPFDSFLMSQAQQLSIASGYGGSIRDPSADGENYQWHLAYNGTFANLIETHSTFQPTHASALTEAATVWPGIMWMLQRPISVSGHVRNARTGEPLAASIVLQGITFPNGEYYMSEPNYGRYHLFLPAGTYTINFSAEGYFSQCQQVTVTQSSSEILEINLAPFNTPPSAPTISGESNGTAGQPYVYTFCATDNEFDDLEYYVQWGDGSSDIWKGPYPCGEEVELTHTYKDEGNYMMKAKVRDTSGEESDWTNFRVTMPVTKNKGFDIHEHPFLYHLNMLLKNILSNIVYRMNSRI